jgi:hypothetical protein
MKTDDLRWCEVPNPPSSGKRAPKWARSAALAGDGTVFIPAVVTGRSEMEVLLCAGYDGTQAVLVGKHTYYPADWIAREWPEVKELALKIEVGVRELFADEADRS